MLIQLDYKEHNKHSQCSLSEDYLYQLFYDKFNRYSTVRVIRFHIEDPYVSNLPDFLNSRKLVFSFCKCWYSQTGLHHPN